MPRYRIAEVLTAITDITARGREATAPAIARALRVTKPAVYPRLAALTARGDITAELVTIRRRCGRGFRSQVVTAYRLSPSGEAARERMPTRDLTDLEVLTLAALASHGASTARTNIYPLLDRLTAWGWIEAPVHPDSGHRRYRLTAAGVAVIRRLAATRRAAA